MLDVGQLPFINKLKKKKKQGLIDFVQNPAKSFDVESGIEVKQTRESSSSNWKELNLGLCWECYQAAEVLALEKVGKDVWRQVDLTRALQWPEPWCRATYDTTQYFNRLSEVEKNCLFPLHQNILASFN